MKNKRIKATVVAFLLVGMIGATIRAVAVPVDLPPVETPPIEAPPIETPPIETPPVNAPPVETPPVEAPPVETPPFYAVPLYPGLVSTTGGPAINGKHQVLDPDEKPIPRLYAAGTCGSVVTRVYSVTGGNIGGCMASGRISGRNAAAEKPWS